MSVQNLRNKFSQNNNTVPYNPHPGLRNGKPVASSILSNNNNNNNNNDVITTNKYQQNSIDGLSRFKTIREEPDNAVMDVEKPIVAKNSSFLQSYLTNEIAKNSGSPTVNSGKSLNPIRVSKFSPRPSAVVVSDVASKFDTPVKPLPPSMPSPLVTEITSSKYSGGIAKSDNCSPKLTVVKSVAPSKFSTPTTTTVKSLPVLNSSGSTNVDNRWKTKYDDLETKRKTLLTQSQKLLREKSDMERQMTKLHTDLQVTKKELSERTLQLSQLRKLSEAMYKEYDQLKQQYELETGTLQKAMERASQWYKQNRELKRRSSALMQKVKSVAPFTLDDLTDDTDGNDNDTEMEELLKTIKELTQEVSRLQAELNKIKLQEFEAQEQTVDLTSELEEERRMRSRVEQELKELKMKHDNLESVSRKVVEETTELHQRYKKEKAEGEKIRSDTNKVKSERDVLARQSQLLMMDAASDEKIMKLLFEVEQLQRTLSQERQEHAEQLKDLQEKLESQSESEQIELYEEKLKLTEAELLCSQQRAEIAESQVDELRRKLEETKTSVIPPPCALPPPPPPPPPMMMPPAPPPPPTSMALMSNLQNIKLKTVSTLNCTNNDESNAIEEMGNYLGLSSPNKGPQVQNGAIDAIINQIKGGRFNLKATDKEKQTPVKKQEPPPVVNEMMNVLGTLRRNPKRRASFNTAPADVAL